MAIGAGTAILASGALGALSGLFGDKERTTSTQVNWPQHYAPVAQDTATLARHVINRPQHVWTGQRSAGPSRMRLASFGKAAQVAGGDGASSGRINTLMDIAGRQDNINKAMSGLTPDEINARMNPYTQGWIQKTLDASDRGNDRAAARRAAMRAGMPGSRGLIAEAQADVDYGRNRDLLTAGMQKQAYERSEDVLERERERLGRFDIQNRSLSGTLARTASSLEDARLQREVQKMNVLRTAGAEQEAFQNQQIRDNMDLFKEVRGYPEDRLSVGQSVLSGIPYGQTQTQPTGRDVISQALGAAAMTAGLGVGNGQTLGGIALKGLGFKRGGRLPLAGGGTASPEMVMSLVESFRESGEPMPPELMMTAQEMGVLPPMPLPEGGNGPGVPPLPTPRPVPLAPGALERMSGPVIDNDSGLPVTARVAGRQADAQAGENGVLTRASASGLTPSVPGAQPTAENPVMGALGRFVSDVNPATGRSHLFEIGSRLMAAGAGNAAGVNPGFMANLGSAIRGAEDSRAKGIQRKQASDLASRKARNERDLAVATLRARYGGAQSSEGKLFNDWQAAVSQYGADSEQATVLRDILVEKGSDPEKLSNVSRMMAERSALDPNDPNYATDKATLDAAISKAATKAPKGSKMRSMNVQFPDGTTSVVRTDDQGNDYVTKDGQKIMVSDLPDNVETYTPVSPTKKGEARAASARMGSIRNLIEDVRGSIANLDDTQIGLAGAMRSAGSDFASMLGDLAQMAGFDSGEQYLDEVAGNVGGGANLKIVPVLENTLFELMMMHKKAVTGTTRILKAQQDLIKEQVSLQGVKSADGIRARVEEVLRKIEQGTYDQEIEARLGAGGSQDVESDIAKADAIVGLK